MTQDLKTKYLLRRLRSIKKSYNSLIDECMHIRPGHPIKELYLSLSQLLDAESTAIKRTLEILLDDPCPHTKTDHQNTRVCSGCDEEEEHVNDGTITPLGPRGFPI